jgi:hypothetical protein
MMLPRVSRLRRLPVGPRIVAAGRGLEASGGVESQRERTSLPVAARESNCQGRDPCSLQSVSERSKPLWTATAMASVRLRTLSFLKIDCT